MNRLRERITRIRMTDQGCMLRAYSRDIVDAIADGPRSQHVHSGARVHVRAQPDRGRRRPRGARRGRVEVFAVPAHPPQLRPRHRLFAGAAAAVLGVRHAGLGRRAGDLSRRHRLPADRRRMARWQALLTRCGTATSSRSSSSAWCCSAWASSANTSGASTSRCARGRATRSSAVLERSPAETAAAAAVTRAVVFAYHNVGARCLEVLLRHGVDVPLVVTHDDDPAETIWFDRVADVAAAHGIAVATPADPNAPDIVARIRGSAPGFPVQLLLPADARRRRCWPFRRAARSTCTARCCRSIAAGRR